MVVEKIKRYVESEFKKPATKYKKSFKNHFVPVHKYAKLLAEKLKADVEIVEIAAWLHDVGSIIYGRKNHHITSCKIAEKKLRELNYPQEKIEKVKHCIFAHRGSLNIKKKTVEAQILADADGIVNFDDVGGLIIAGMKYENKTKKQAKKSVKKKIKNCWKKLSKPAKKFAKGKYKKALKTLKCL